MGLWKGFQSALCPGNVGLTTLVGSPWRDQYIVRKNVPKTNPKVDGKNDKMKP